MFIDRFFRHNFIGGLVSTPAHVTAVWALGPAILAVLATADSRAVSSRWIVTLADVTTIGALLETMFAVHQTLGTTRTA